MRHPRRRASPNPTASPPTHNRPPILNLGRHPLSEFPPSRSLRIQLNKSHTASSGAQPVEAQKAQHSSSEAPERGPKRWKNRAPLGTIVALFDAALEHGAVQACLYQTQRMLITYDQQAAAVAAAAVGSLPTRWEGVPGNPAPGVASNTGAGSAPLRAPLAAAASQGAKQHVLDSLRGRHQRMLRTCVTARQLPTALTYIQLLPRNAPLFTAFMKECVAHCTLEEMRQVLKVR